MPIKLNFSIGGFSDCTRFIRLVNETLQYGESVGAPEQGWVQGTVVPNEREWIVFKKSLDDIGVWKWKKRYINSNILDGTQWELVIEYGDKKLKSYGSNSYPDEFNKLRIAFGLLLGKENII